MIIPILLFFGLACYLHEAEAKTIKVAIIDTGMPNGSSVKLCRDGHKNFTDEEMKDLNGHATNVSELIHNTARDSDYCAIIIKIWSKSGKSDIYVNTVFDYVRSLKPDIINLSGGYSLPLSIDRSKDLVYKSVKSILDDRIIFVNSAGNDNFNLDRECIYYPACYDSRMVVVGNSLSDGTRQPMSNYGNLIIDRWEMGTSVGPRRLIYTGTSQAAAIATGKIVLNLHKLINLKPKEAR